MAMPRATNTITNPGDVSTGGTGSIIPPVQLPTPSPTGQDLVNKMRGYNKGTAKVAPMPTHGSFRGDASGKLNQAEFTGIPHPSLAPFAKK